MFSLPCLPGSSCGFAFRPLMPLDLYRETPALREERKILISHSDLATDSKHNPVTWHVSVLVLTFMKGYDENQSALTSMPIKNSSMTVEPLGATVNSWFRDSWFRIFYL